MKKKTHSRMVLTAARALMNKISARVRQAHSECHRTGIDHLAIRHALLMKKSSRHN